MPGLVHLMHALICTGFIKFLGSPLPVVLRGGFFAWWHNTLATEFLITTVAMKT